MLAVYCSLQQFIHAATLVQLKSDIDLALGNIGADVKFITHARSTSGALSW